MNGTGAGNGDQDGRIARWISSRRWRHGSRPADTRLEVNGVNINIFGQRQDSTYANFQDGNVQEYSFEISAHSAESETGGVRVTIVPKDGGNRYSGQFFANFANEKFQSTNMTPELSATGLGIRPTVSLGRQPIAGRTGGARSLVVLRRILADDQRRLKAGTYFNTDLAWRPTFDTPPGDGAREDARLQHPATCRRLRNTKSRSTPTPAVPVSLSDRRPTSASNAPEGRGARTTGSSVN